MSVSAHLLVIAPPYEAEMLRRAGGRAGYRVTVCDPTEAVSRQAEIRADAVILSSGAVEIRELALELRAQPEGTRLPIVAVGGGSAERAHADAVAPRPVDP